MKPCVTARLQAEADAAERRRDAAIERLLSCTAGRCPAGDTLENAVRAPIDAGERVLETIGRGKP